MAEAVSCVAEAEEAARVICALRFADLGGRPPAWRKPLPDSDPHPEALDAAAAEAAQPREVPRWPRAARGKRSQRPTADGIRRAPRDPSAEAEAAEAAAAAARVKRMRASPASPLDYSGGSAATTSGGGGGGADEGSTSSADGRVGPTTATNNKVGMIGRQQLIRSFQTPPAKNPRPGKKKALPDLQKEVRSLVEENETLRKAAEDLLRACAAASAENQTLQLRLNQRNTPIRSDSPAPRAKQEPDAPHRGAPPPPVQCDGGEGGGFRIPDLNLPASDDL